MAKTQILSCKRSLCQNPTRMMADIIRKDAKISGIKKLMKKDAGVTINTSETTPTNFENDKSAHLMANMYVR